MASGFSRTTDCIDLQNVALKYDRFSKELDDTPRLVAGSNLLGFQNGKLAKRPGFTQYLSLPAVTGRIDRLWLYRTEEDPAKIYVLASVKGATTWTMYYIRPDAGTPAWTSLGTLRGLNASTRVHEAEIHKGKVYIKSYPTAGDKYGSVVWDGSGTPTLRLWGVPAPTVAARMNNPAGWGASAHPVDVRLGWKYAYSWETPDGHMGSRSPQETNPDVQSSNTGAFVTKKPKVDVQGTADATNLTKIRIWRTQDGGGNFLNLDSLTNTGAGTITYEDNKRASSAGNQDPIADFMLNTSDIAPSETSNAPPPPVTDPKVEGTDAPEKSTNIKSHAGRLWYAIRGILFFSALEEVINGLPEHSWPTGFSGNYFPTGEISVAIEVTQDGLIHFTHKNTYIVEGFNRASFAPRPLLLGIGMHPDHPRAHAAYQDLIFWLTQDFRVVAYANGKLMNLGKDLAGEIKGSVSADREVEFAVYVEDDKQYLMVLLADKVNSANSKVWVYDLVTGAWNTPWPVRLTAVVSGGQPREAAQTQELIGAHWDGTSSALVKMDFTTKRDYLIGTGNTDYVITGDTSLMRVPIGNHMNPLRRPVVVPDMVGFILQRKKFASDTEPTVASALDDTGISFTTMTAKDPPRRDAPTWFSEKWYYLNSAAQRVALRISKTAVNEDFELQTLAFIYRPEMGGG